MSDLPKRAAILASAPITPALAVVLQQQQQRQNKRRREAREAEPETE